MKAKIHPKYYSKITVTCMNCGATFVIGSTSETVVANLCSQCHPAYTKKQDVYVDTANRISRYMARQQKAEAMKKKG